MIVAKHGDSEDSPRSSSATKVLVVSFVQPFPADDGKKVVLQGLVRYFLDSSGMEVHYLVLDGVGPRQPPDSRLTFHSLSHRTRRLRLLAALVRSIVQRRPLQQTLLYSDALRRAIRQRMSAIDPDIVVYDTIRVSQFVENLRALLPGARHILYLDDLFSIRYGTMLRAMDRYPQARIKPLGNFAKYLPTFCQPLLNLRTLCRYLLKREMQLVEKVEVTEVARFDINLLVNCDEVKVLRERTAQDRIATLPISFPHRDQPLPTRNYEGKPEFIFIGALNVAHNQCSLEYFISNIFGDCVECIPALKLRVVGQTPSEDLRRLFARYSESIEWNAWVPDLGRLFATSSAMLVPLLFGSGVKVKTLEALSYALPVISTQFGAEGILSGSSEASGIIVEDNLRRFPQHMRALLDPQKNSDLSKQARQYYAAHYTTEACVQQYRALFDV